jgi:hypothetical protein
MRRARVVAVAGALAAVAAVASPALGGRRHPSALLVGEVLVCNAPGHCLQQAFEVSAINRSGAVAGRTSTVGPHNSYRLRVVPGEYSLEAVAEGGLRCKGSADAVAHRTVTANITCLVP